MKPARRVHRTVAVRISLFLIVFTSVMLSATWLACATWNYFWDSGASSRWELIFPGLTLGFVATTVLGRLYSNFALRVVYRTCAVWLGILNYCFFAAGAAWIFYGAATLLSFHIEPRLIASAFFGAGIIISAFGVVNAEWLRVTRVPVKLANLPANWQDRTVALVTDMHLGNVRGAGFTRRVVATIQQLKPDAIFISGDMFDGTKGDLDALLEPWKEISATAKIYFVTGNHEEFTDRAKYLEATQNAGIRVLNNEKVELDGLQIVGVHDSELHDPEAFRALIRGTNLDQNRPAILLAHQPLNLDIPEAEGVSLQLSGHTHGGQIWPWYLGGGPRPRTIQPGSKPTRKNASPDQ